VTRFRQVAISPPHDAGKKKQGTEIVDEGNHGMRRQGGGRAPSSRVDKLLQTAPAEKGAASRRKCARLPHLQRKTVNRFGPTSLGSSATRRARGGFFQFPAGDAFSFFQGGEWSYDDISKFIANPRALFRPPSWARPPEGQRAAT